MGLPFPILLEGIVCYHCSNVVVNRGIHVVLFNVDFNIPVCKIGIKTLKSFWHLFFDKNISWTFIPVPCQSAPSLFLKSNFEYLRGNYRKAVKLLNSSNIAEHPGPIKTGNCDYTFPLTIVFLCTNSNIVFTCHWCQSESLFYSQVANSLCSVTLVSVVYHFFQLCPPRWMCSVYVLEQSWLHSLCNGETQPRNFLLQESITRKRPHLCTARRWRQWPRWMTESWFK